MFDRDGCGQEDKCREDIETIVEEKLSSSGWNNRAVAVVIEPELENWVWSDSPNVDKILGWENRTPKLKEWLISKGYLEVNASKPSDPKQAVLEALKIANKKRSSSIYRELAESVSLKHCQDPSFNKFKTTLQTWFPE